MGLTQWIKSWFVAPPTYEQRRSDVIELALAQMMTPPANLAQTDYFTHVDCHVIHDASKETWMVYVANWKLAFEGQTPEAALEKMWQYVTKYCHMYHMSRGREE